MKTLDLTGNKYGNLEVLCFNHTDKENRYWKCKCSCGNERIVKTRGLTSGSAKTCLECLKAEDFTGKTFHQLKILEIKDRKHNQNRYKCLCSCGKIHITSQAALKYGKVKSCFSCATRKNVNNIPINYIKSLIKGAILRKIEYNVTPEYLSELIINQNYKCNLSGLPIEFRVNNTRTHSASVDRIDNTKGYVKGNCQWVHKTVNKMKQDLESSEFIILCTHIAQYNNITLP